MAMLTLDDVRRRVAATLQHAGESTAMAESTECALVLAEAQGLGSHGMSRIAQTVSHGADGASRNWVSRLDSIEIARTRLQHIVGRYAEDEAGAFSSRTEAGNIGNDLLSGFVVEVDYGRGRMVRAATGPRCRRPSTAAACARSRKTQRRSGSCWSRPIRRQPRRRDEGVACATAS